MTYRECAACKKTQPITNYRKKGEYYYRTCNNCHNKTRREKRGQISAYIRDYKSAHGCAKCGYSKETHPFFTPRALEFHHPQNNKEFNIGNATKVGCSINRIKKEMEKCVVLCARCHIEIHNNEV